jgi:pyridoxamine 5'-phosphate oxidase
MTQQLSPALPKNPPDDPIGIFLGWLAEARIAEPADADAACLATVDPAGMPNARMVLVRRIDARGFAFFTNYRSRKGQEILAAPKAALCFHWKSLERQVRVQGAVEQVGNDEADAYFGSRPRGSRIAAWASLQSEDLPERSVLETRVREYEAKYADRDDPPRPPHWSGFRVVPSRIEFWQQTEFRLHSREVWERSGAGWDSRLLYP